MKLLMRVKNQKGASLIEVLISITIIVIAVVPLMGGFNIGMGLIKSTQAELLALQLASQQMEQFKNDFAKGTLPLAISTPQYKEKPLPVEDFPFFEKSTVTEVISTFQNTVLVKVTVTVYWEEKGRERKVKLLSYLSYRN